MGQQEETYYLIRSDMLPEAIRKTVKAKQMLASGEAQTVQDAVHELQQQREVH